MTAEDLKELGVTSFGHRRKLLAAIAALGAEPPTRDAAQSATSATSAPTSPPPIDAERRQLTVMFCDLVGSTALSTRFDPEDLRELIGDYHRAVADTVGRFDGFVAKYMGDGVLIYFGYPQAHEDDAERAVRAGLAVIEAVGRLPARQDLRVRLGIATGLAVVGDLLGEGAAQERGVVGETPNLAARLQALAAPNTLVIGEATRRQVGGLFELADLGPQALAGFAEPQSAWRVVGESGMLSRFEALRSGETPLVGREEEVELLLRRWEQAKSGEGRVVLISGEPGIGKSRLTAALSEQIGTEPHTRLRYFCSPHHQNSALYPVIVQLERAAGFERDDGPEAKLDKLETLLGPAAEIGDVSLLVELLSVPGGDRFAPLELSPQRKKERTFAALLRQLEGLARTQPVLMIFEDLHWIDPTSREFLDLVLARIDRLPVLLAATFRPEFQPPWVGQAHATVIALNRLGRGDGAVMVERLAGNAALLPPDVIAEIVERTDGVPLFVEEMTKAVLEAGAERGGEIAASVPSAGLGVPATLQASLMARLDRLGPAAKGVAQIGAAIGREFSYELAASVGELADERLQDALHASSMPAWSFSAERRRRPRTCSSTPWSRIRPTTPCCGRRDGSCIAPQRDDCWRVPSASRSRCRSQPRRGAGPAMPSARSRHGGRLAMSPGHAMLFGGARRLSTCVRYARHDTAITGRDIGTGACRLPRPDDRRDQRIARPMQSEQMQGQKISPQGPAISAMSPADRMLHRRRRSWLPIIRPRRL